MQTTPTRQVTSRDRITYTVETARDPKELFETLANPHRHHELDGSGSVQAEVTGPERLTLGDEFVTHMELNHLRYKIRNRVTAFEDGRLIEWTHPGGHQWRWEIEPLAEGGARVTETWNTAGAKMPRLGYVIVGAFRRNDDGIRETLARLAS
ncbi:SRPBCC family protein [Falsarthrobacter nasiphocae]|uniref:Polyketide cyclase / dehydrase and lipid transport n=1 Tax=Falsarthrobacter nasiphocae TaxID=189863 RepID=A0AAE3YE74_9MICC|nr:dimethyladenosine transferase [Falsarthrobacter nasiphocae]MDR6892248.1 hypothetical protein [Falsarthrobacter nasiphocae]